MKSTANVFAIDVGYGNTKSAFRNGSEIATQMFPSLAPLAVKNAISGFGHGLLDARKITCIDVEGTSYEVGPGVALSSAYGNAGRTLSEDYCTTANYAALLGGALHFANVDTVERLVLGLPVHTYNKYAADLSKRFTGKMNFGDTEVTIKNVMVMPQPLGALIYFSRYHREQFDQVNSHLVVDVGYFTTDWVVAKGLTMDDRRSGGAPGGASQIYQRIAQLISNEKGEPADDIERIDQCLRENLPLLFCGDDIPLAPYLAQSQAVISATVKEMQNKVGRTNDLRSIVLTGGGAALYLPVMQQAFQRVRIDLVEAPCFANVNGFFAAGEATLRRDLRKLGAAA